MAAQVNDASFFTRRGIVAVSIIVLHILGFWALASGLAQRVVAVLAPPLEADIVEEVKDDEPPPPPPPPEMERPPVEVPPPEVAIDLPMETTTTAIQDVTDKPPPPAPPPPPRAAGSPAKMKSAADPDQFYPPGKASRGARLPGRASLRWRQWPLDPRTRRHRNLRIPGTRRCRGQGSQGQPVFARY